jgi:oxygen-independent coproporphyrinogen-3 oxidase
MNIEIMGHDGKNAVLQIMQLFFDASSDAEVKSCLFKENGKYIASAEVKKDGKVGKGMNETESEERLYVMNCIKKSVFYAAKEISDMPTPWGISTGIRPAKTARGMIEAEKADDEILSFLKSEYLMEDKKAHLALEVAKNERKIISSMAENSVSIYVGIPFCPSRCSYCSFISRATEHNGKYVLPYVEALKKEIIHSAKIVKDLGQKIDSLYFGGGTPTAIDVCLLESLIDCVRENFDLSGMKEFTVEAGRPDTFSPEMMKMLKSEGVTRISINPQTMHDETLRKIGRCHSVEDVTRAFYIAREAGFDSINADLIAGLPGEDENMMEESLEKISELKPESVTVHTLYMKRASQMIEDFARLRFAKDTSKMVDIASEMLRHGEMKPYYMYKQRNTLGNLENVGYAKENHESRYNVFIMEEVQPILALGAGGSTKMVTKGGIDRIFNPKDAADYTERIEEVLSRKDLYKQGMDK